MPGEWSGASPSTPDGASVPAGSVGVVNGRQGVTAAFPHEVLPSPVGRTYDAKTARAHYTMEGGLPERPQPVAATPSDPLDLPAAGLPGEGS